MSPDPFGRALRDHYHDDRDTPLIQRDGDRELIHPIEQFYFGDFSTKNDVGKWLIERLDGPLLDMGAGVGQHALYFQDHFETIAIEVSEYLVEIMRERGVSNAKHADMFALKDTFERDQFRSALAHGTQLGLVGSMQGLRRFLGNLALVTMPNATAVLDCYDPEREETTNLLGYRADPTQGLAYRVMHFEYKGEVSETLLFRLFSPKQLRKATVGTGWEVTEIRRRSGENAHHYYAVLTKS